MVDSPRVHSGFCAYYQSIQGVVIDALIGMFANVTLKGYDLMITGHSLGGGWMMDDG